MRSKPQTRDAAVSSSKVGEPRANTKAQKIARLKNKEYRDAFVASQISVGLPFQIRALREQKGWKQSHLAEKAGMLQPRISAMESPGGAKFNLETLRRLASAFDVGLAVRFVPFGELVDWSENFNADTFRVPSFNEELSKLEESIQGSAFADDPAFQEVPTQQWVIGSDLAAIQRYTEKTRRMAEDLGLESPGSPESLLSAYGNIYGNATLEQRLWGIGDPEQILFGGGADHPSGTMATPGRQAGFDWFDVIPSQPAALATPYLDVPVIREPPRPKNNVISIRRGRRARKERVLGRSSSPLRTIG